jgi:hypothetical protein
MRRTTTRWLHPRRPVSGTTSSSTNDLRIVVMALPTMTPTARSMALPLPMKLLKSDAIDIEASAQKMLRTP